MTARDSNRTPPPLSPAALAWLAYERDVVPQSEVVRARALARAREALRPVGVVRYAPRSAWAPMRRLLVAAAAGIVLVAGAAAAYQMLRPLGATAPSGAPTTPAIRHAVAVPPSAESAPENAAIPDVAPRALAPKAGRHATFTGRHGAPPEEVRLLVRARRADARGDYLGVLTIAAEHERNHPTGRLAEEREALRVKALVGLGRASEARQVAAKFRRQFPRSVLLHKIEDMLASLR